MVIRDDQAHAGQAAGEQAAQEAGPGGAVLGREDVDAEDLALAVGVDPGRDRGADVDHPAAVAAALGQRVDPEIGVGTAVQGPIPELVDHAVQALGHHRDLGLGEVADAQRLDQALHPAGGDARQVSLCYHGHQSALRSPAGLEQPSGK